MLKMVDVYSESSRSFATLAGVDVTMVKATQGTGYVNPKCDIDYQAAKKAGKLLGVYHYAGGGNPEREAQYFYKNVKGYVGEAVPAVDWESGENASWGDHNWVRRFVDEFHRLTGVWCLIYVQASAINQVANCAKDCGLWVASYPSMDWKSWTVPD
ncbi:MAG: glycoside hydrolase family 25, partial [Lactobacillus sp.]|nr:glycoside hydrolase family 25 [Lactobacillus sp.]